MPGQAHALTGLAACLYACLYGLGYAAGALVRRFRAFDVGLIGLTRYPRAARVPGFGLAAVYALQDRRVCLSSKVLVINTAHGPVVQCEALYETLVDGHLGGAGLDVFWREPFPPDNPLLTLSHVVATVHVGGVADLSYAEIADAVTINIERLCRGEPPLCRVA